MRNLDEKEFPFRVMCDPVPNGWLVYPITKDGDKERPIGVAFVLDPKHEWHSQTGPVEEPHAKYVQ